MAPQCNLKLQKGCQSQRKLGLAPQFTFCVMIPWVITAFSVSMIALIARGVGKLWSARSHMCASGDKYPNSAYLYPTKLYIFLQLDIMWWLSICCCLDFPRMSRVTLDSWHCHHNDCNDVSNHQPHDCLLSHLFRRGSKKTSKLRVTGLCFGEFTVDLWISHTKGQ